MPIRNPIEIRAIAAKKAEAARDPRLDTREHLL